MKRLFIAILLFTTIGIQIYAQVETRYYQNSDTIPGIKKSQRKTSLESIIKIPKFNLDKILKEDTEMDGEDVPYRFGKGFDVSYSLADGQWESVEDGRLWSLTFESEGAVSLNYIFENFYLPEGAYLYIENKERNVFYGPVTPEVFASDGGTFLTDIIPLIPVPVIQSKRLSQLERKMNLHFPSSVLFMDIEVLWLILKMDLFGRHLTVTLM